VKSLYLLLRHLPTVEDQLGLFSDPDAEVPLLDVDRERFGSVVATIKALRAGRTAPLMILSSANGRSATTMDLLAVDVPASAHVADPRLANIRHPEWNGVNQKAVTETELYRKWHTTPTSVEFPHGETLLEVASRVDNFLEELPPTADFVFISHSTPLQVIACRLLRLPLDAIWSFYFEPYAVTAIMGGVLTRFNDVAGRPCNYDALYE
jgi:broad specificity phosphatase PhoE